MRERLISLREKRAALVAEAAQQRAHLHGLVQRAEAASVWVERARGVVGHLKAHPLWIVAGVALLVALRPRRVLGLLASGYSIWRTWVNLRRWLERTLPTASPVLAQFTAQLRRRRAVR